MIIFLSREIKTGGEKYIFELYKYLKTKNLKVIPVYVDEMPIWSRKLGLFFDCFVSNFYFLFKIKSNLKDSNIIIIEDFHYHPRLILCNFFIKFLKKNVKIVSLMQLALFYHNLLKNNFLKKLDDIAIKIFFSQIEMIFCNSIFTKNEAETLKINPEKIKVVYCGHEILNTPNLERVDKDKINILCVAQCAPYKGMIYLIEAVSNLSKDRFHLDIVGSTQADSKYFLKLIRKVKENSLEKNIFFHDHIKDEKVLNKFYKNADVFVLPSLVEGFGIVILEAMSYGLPIIATNAGAIPELVKDKKNGILVPIADSNAIYKSLENFINSYELRKNLGDNNRKFYLENKDFYTWEKVGDRIFQQLNLL
jgi:glycosyltransferase involved in cell wall biosynthesis